MFKPRWYILLALIGFATLVRLFPYIWMQFNIEVDPRYSMFLPWNFAPLMAIVLLAGAHFRDPEGLKFRNSRYFSWALLVPLIVLVGSDLGIYLISGHLDWAIYPNQPIVYGTMLFCGLLSLNLRRRETAFPSAVNVAGMGLLAETIFFLATNFGVWKLGTMYPHTAEGLWMTYVAGFPFYVRSLVSTAIYGGLLFGGVRVLTAQAAKEDSQQTVATNAA